MAGLAAILVPSSLTAQITFQRTYGGASSDYGYSVRQTADSGFIIAGSTFSFGAGGEDVYLIKTDANGETLWTTTYGDTSEDVGYSVSQTIGGGYAIVGYRRFYIEGDEDVDFIKTDADGAALWTSTYGGAGYDEGWSVQQTSDTGYIITGITSSFGAGGCDVYLIKTDVDGDTLWTRTYGGAAYDRAYSARQTAEGGYIMAGTTTSFGAGGYDVYLIKTDARGDTLWTRTYGDSFDDVGRSVQQTDDGGYVIAGYTEFFGGGGYNVYLIKTNPSGDTLWTRTYGGNSDDAGSTVQQTADSGYIIAGWTFSFGADHCDVYIVKTDASGNTVWTRTFDVNVWDYGYSAQQTADGGYVIAGYAAPRAVGREDIYLIKTDSLGNVAVAEPKTSPTRDPALSLSCEPNPFRTRTAISLQLTAHSPAELAIFDAAGRCVRTFTVNREPYTVWDGTDELGHALPSGTYFLRLAAGGRHATARLVLQR
jgi:hypothetical protein